MLLRAPVAALKAGQISKRFGHMVVVMRHYPRYTPKDSVHEYVRALAPGGELFAEFKAQERALKDHNRAFELVRYEERFALGDGGERELARLSELARTQDVYLLCQCSHEDRCHCDLLLLMARARHQAPIAQLPFSYPVFAARLAADDSATRK